MRAPDPPSVDAAGVEALLERVAAWAAAEDGVRGAALVGSWARGTAGEGSDVDVVLLTDHPERYVDDDTWVAELGGGRVVATRPWGFLTERRVALAGGLELDLGVVMPDWARTDPVDPGTRAVVAAGMRPLHDPEGLLRELAAAVSRGA